MKLKAGETLARLRLDISTNGTKPKYRGTLNTLYLQTNT